jgi:hypothetical protein
VGDALDQVRRFAALGARLLALEYRGKRPRAACWTADGEPPDAVERHVARGGNYAVLCGRGLAVLDVDAKSGGVESLARLEADLGLDLSRCPTVWTGSGGGSRHVYFQAPVADRFRTTLAQYPGLEFRAGGRAGAQYVVGPGSTHPSGELYRWDPAALDRIEAAEFAGDPWLPPAPPALLARYTRPPVEPSAELSDPEPIERLQAALDAIPTEECREYGRWLQVGMALHAGSGGDPEALGLWIEWSARDPQYADEAADACEAKWDTFRAGRGVGVGTLYALAREFSGAVPERLPEQDFEPLPPLSPPEQAEPEASDFGSLPVGEFLERIKPAPPIVEGLLYGSGVHVLFGPWGLGKTYVALDLALHVALGRDVWQGRPLYLAGPVEFFLAEGAYAVPTRLRAFAAHWKIDARTADLRLRPAGLDLSSRATRAASLRYLAWRRPRLLIVDTLAASMGAGDENSAKDVGVVLRWGRHVHEHTGATVLFVHHPGHKNQGHARGSSAIEANTDGVIALKRSSGGRGRFAIAPKKVRSGRPAPPLALRLLEVALGEDPERPGRQIVDSVVVPDTSASPELEALAEAVREAGDALPLADAAEIVAELRSIEAKSGRKWLQSALREPEARFFGLALDGETVRFAPDADEMLEGDT